MFNKKKKPLSNKQQKIDPRKAAQQQQADILIKEELLKAEDIQNNADDDSDQTAIDTNVDYWKWRNDPMAMKKFKSITKDIPLSNLTDPQEFILTEHFDVLFQLLAFGSKTGLNARHNKKPFFGPAADFLEAQIHAVANVSLGRKGFARRMDASTFKEEKKTTSEDKPKSWFQKG